MFSQQSLVDRIYSPTKITKAWSALHAGDPIPPRADDDVPLGVNQVACVEPLFGYTLEKLPWQGLHNGSPPDMREGYLNINDPRCEFYPEANHCHSGDQFKATDLTTARAFLSWSPIPFERPWLQRVADFASVATAVAVLAMLAAGLARRRS